MMFSAINEAFNNPIKEQINNYDLNNDNNHHKFFNAQGDVTDNPNIYQGTSIKSLENIQQEAMKEFEDDTLYTDSILDIPDIRDDTPNHSHQYYISHFLSTLNINDDVSDLQSLLSSTDRDSEIMKHIRSCKYCKKKITDRLQDINQEQKIEDKTKHVKFDIFNNKFGYEFREILIIILIGILIIFVLDLFFRFGQRVSNIRP